MGGRGLGRREGSAAVNAAKKDAGSTAKVPSAKERGVRTRRRIAEAALALLEENEHPPTAKEIAARAEVSHRLVFHHFQDLESLLAMVAALQVERYRNVRAEVSPHLPLAERVEQTVKHRFTLYESMGHLGSNVSALAGRVQAVADGAADVHKILRARLEHTFRAELDAAGRRGRELLCAIDTAVSWHVWDYLQRVNQLSPAATRRVMVQLLEGAVSVH